MIEFSKDIFTFRNSYTRNLLIGGEDKMEVIVKCIINIIGFTIFF